MDSCVKESYRQPQDLEALHEVVFHASWEPETKTVLQQDGSIWWEPEDSIALFVWPENGTGFNKYSLKADCEEPSSKTNFVGVIGEEKGTFMPYFAISPYKNAQSNSSFTIPSVQYSPIGTFASDQIVSFARSNDNHLTFHNAFAGIKFSVAHEGIKKIVFKNREDSYPITGAMYIQFWLDFPDAPGIAAQNSGVSNSLTVYPKDSECFIPGEFYYASIRPGNASLVISFYTDTQVATIGLYDRWIDRSTMVSLRELDKDLSFKNNDNYTYATLGYWGSLLPEGIDKDDITEVVFHTSSSVKTPLVVPCSIPRYVAMGYYDFDYYPVYFELIGSTAHYYTEADRYRMGGTNCISFADWHELKSVDLSMFDTSYVTNFDNMFCGCLNLENVNLSSFDTSNGRKFSGMFQGCNKLKGLDISNFSSKSVVQDEFFQPFTCMFNKCFNLTSLDLGNFEIPEGVDHCMLGFARNSRNCAIRCSASTREALSSFSSRLGDNVNYITWVLPGDVLPVLEPYQFDYYSTDYSKDMTYKVLQTASVGNGINIVLMGDGYSDRLIADGSYDTDMISAMNAIFKDEPYASFRDCFNVFEIYAVSENEKTGESNTAFRSFIGGLDPENGYLAYHEDYYVNKYAKIPNEDISETCVVLILNQEAGFVQGIASPGWIIEGDDVNAITDYSKGGSVAMVCRKLGDAFPFVVAHEFGHGFAKLGDEYCVYVGSMEDWEKEEYLRLANNYGWWANLDFTNDPELIKWSRFLTDERYNGTGIGIFEGATYPVGVWRPSQTSIMQSDCRGMFNAPSREAIYKRIHRLALGKEWQFDYETFVEYDQKNINEEKATAQFYSVPKATQVPMFEKRPMIKVETVATPTGNKKRVVIFN